MGKRFAAGRHGHHWRSLRNAATVGRGDFCRGFLVRKMPLSTRFHWGVFLGLLESVGSFQANRHIDVHRHVVGSADGVPFIYSYFYGVL